jgi:glyoxylase-like metal-dependent hydrolase (beta-lactamase superfamily II)
MNPTTFSSTFALCAAAILSASTAQAEINTVEKVAPDVYFHEGDLLGRGHCNNGWIVFRDYVLVIDGNFPSGANDVIPKIRAVTDKPIRFVFNTHHHGDHAYGNHVWMENGATAVAHEGVLSEMKRHETGYFGGKPGRWEDAAKGRPDVASSKLTPPTLLFSKDMIFDDGNHRVELLHFGVAHTRGDGFAWLPKERILFTGDACVNGPFNFTGDGDTGQWVQTLELAARLGAAVICPGHGPKGAGEVLKDQRDYFAALRAEVKKLVDAGKKPAEVKAAVNDIKAALRKNPRIERYVGDFFSAQVDKVYTEMGGKPFDSQAAASDHHHHKMVAGGGDLHDADVIYRRVP